MTMRIGQLSFQPRPATTIAAIVGLAVFVALGQWQGRRAEEKRGIQARLEARGLEPPVQLTGFVSDPAALVFRHVLARGQWIPERQIFIDNRIHEGRAGFEVVTPLRLEGTANAVLVDRGWVARKDAIYPRHPDVSTPSGRAEVSGLAVRPPERVLELSTETVAGDTWQNLVIERYAARSGLALLPIVILAKAPGEGLRAAFERPDAGIAKHVEYQLTWYALAATTLVLWLALNTRRTP